MVGEGSALEAEMIGKELAIKTGTAGEGLALEAMGGIGVGSRDSG